MTVLLTAFTLGGCKKNVGTPEDNAVVETDKTKEKEDQAEYVFGYSCVDMSNPFYDTLKTSIETELETQGDSLVVKDAGSDIETQLQQVQELIDEEVDAVFLCPVDWEKITPALEALKDADIPVVNLDTEVREGSLVTAFVGSDNRNAGYVCGQDLVERRPDGGAVVIVENQNVNSVNERTTGFEEAIANSGFRVVKRITAGIASENVKEEMLSVLSEESGIDAVMCGSDRMAVRVLEALEESGRKDMLVYSVDGSPEIKKELSDPLSPMTGIGAQSPIGLGKTAVKTATAILKDKDYEKSVYVETFLINRDNVEMYGTDGWQ